MGDGYDRLYEPQNNGSGMAGFAMGMLTGAVVGAGVALLFAPKTGSALRKQLSRQAETIAKQADTIVKNASETAQDGYRRVTETANDWSERGKDAIGKAREVLTQSADDGKEAYGKAREAVAKGADGVAAAARRG